MGIGIAMVLVAAVSTVPPVDGASPAQSSASGTSTESPGRRQQCRITR